MTEAFHTSRRTVHYVVR